MSIPKYREIAENLIGREILPDEVVHHIDLNHYNDNPKNLQVMKRVEHIKLHNLITEESRRRKCSIARLGKKNSKETREKMSITHTGVKLSEEHAIAIGKGHIGLSHTFTKEQLKNLSESHKGHVYSDFHKKSISVGVKEWWRKRKENVEC